MDAERAWQAVLGQLQMDMPKASFDTWVRDTHLVDDVDGRLVIGVRNAYARDWLESRLASTITRMLVSILEADVQVEFVVLQAGQDAYDPAEKPASQEQSQGQSVVKMPNSTLNPRYTFENYIVGSSNRLAHAAALAVAEKPARAYNPLFLYGGVGLGKTHLLHAIGNACHECGLSVLYVSSEEFTNDLINAIRERTTQAFRDKYRSIDVLMVDDIQFIAGKESTQEEFFHTFNTLHGQDKQIILSSDRPPKALVTLEERLRSRFEWGLTADIQAPDIETRLAILRAKAERRGRQVPDDILELIARRVQSNIRELEGALNRVLAFSDLSGSTLTTDLAETALVDVLPQQTSLNPERVVGFVARFYNMSEEKLLSRDRSKDVVLPRQIAMYLLREMANISLPAIGETLGGRDHTTVIHAIEKISKEVGGDTGSKISRDIRQIRQQLTSLAAAI